MRRDAPSDERRRGDRPLCGRRAAARSRGAVLPRSDPGQHEDPDLSFVDKLRDPEQSTSRPDLDPEPAERQRDPEHDDEIAPDDDHDEERPPRQHAARVRAH